MTKPYQPEIIQHDPQSFRPFQLAVGDLRTIDAVDAHITRTLGEPEFVYHEIISDQVHVDVYIIPPSKERPYQVLVTSGMSERAMTMPEEYADQAYAELCMILPPDWPLTTESLKDDRHAWPLKWLRMLARFPHVSGSFFASGHTLPNGDPAEAFHSTTPFACWFFTLPVPLPAPFRVLKEPDREVQFLLVVPITEAEMQLRLKQGPEALIPCLSRVRPAEYFSPARQTADAGMSLSDSSASMRLALSNLPKMYSALMRTPGWRKIIESAAPKRSMGMLAIGILLLFSLVTIPLGLVLILRSGRRRRAFFREFPEDMQNARAIFVYPIMINSSLRANPRGVAPGLFMGSLDPAAPGKPAFYEPIIAAMDRATVNSTDPALVELAKLLADQRYVEGRRRLIPLELTGGVRVHLFDTLVCGDHLNGTPFDLPMAVALVTEGQESGRIHLVPLDVMRVAVNEAERAMQNHMASRA